MMLHVTIQIVAESITTPLNIKEKIIMSNNPDNPQAELDTNQASEDELDKTLLAVFRRGQNHKKATLRSEEMSIEEAKAQISALIRTEKLKLLAEVRERVVGEPIPHNWDDDIDGMAKWKYYTEYR